ncbi:uncharacterized protein [Eurosta solidaginis]|uniref:uncharacterized protein n=1 Tax=Eurosta solidaginis TaxID=178769 RepID=UPI0035305999
MTFGISCGPCIAHYVRNKNAEEYRNIYPRAYEAINNAHYVDDYIDTADDDEAALEVAEQVRKVHLAGGFEIRNWASNSVVVLAKLLGGNPGVQTSVQFGDTEKILGLLARYTVGLKILIQRVWRANIGWDEELPETLYEDWLKWRQLLPLIEAVEIPRCYSRNLKFATDVGIHTFVDASEHAYAAVWYVRVRQGDDVDVTLIAAKSKVAPLKPISIPRLELQAAVVGVRLTQKVIKIRGLEHRNTTYWSDSKTVLQWLNMDPRSFQQFVMHRVGEILESSDMHSEVLDTTELRKRVCVNYKVAPIALNVEYFSKWRNLYRAVATFILYIFKLKSRRVRRIMPKEVTPDMIEIAENILFKQAQAEIYSSEINVLYAGHALNKQSKLYQLNAYVDDKGILRIRSRLDSINEHTDTIVLPRESYITFLIVRDYHEKNHHMAHETVINNVKGKYCIPRLRVLYNKIRKSCQRCKINNALPEPPQMSPIPAARLASFTRPFTFTGVDYFGPVLVNVGRHKEKRWGVLYTCLTLRAVHFEIAHSLDTNSCIMALRNFMARRGTPAEIFSDNGTNFKATEKLVREKLITLDFDRITAKYDRIKWRFNPPGAPHMGGAWERLVRTTKNILRSICPSYSFNDESLRCALMEVEFIINSRPLTFVSLESSDDIALTPNHMLLGSADGHKPAFSDGMDLRQRWHKTQLFADVFWQRWVKEYTPILTMRAKWLKKATPIVIDDVVIVIDETLPRNLWPKGRVISTIVAKDGQVRRVTVKTPLGIMERPATKIAKLDVGNSLVSTGATYEGGNVTAIINT